MASTTAVSINAVFPGSEVTSPLVSLEGVLERPISLSTVTITAPQPTVDIQGAILVNFPGSSIAPALPSHSIVTPTASLNNTITALGSSVTGTAVISKAAPSSQVTSLSVTAQGDAATQIDLSAVVITAMQSGEALIEIVVMPAVSLSSPQASVVVSDSTVTNIPQTSVSPISASGTASSLAEVSDAVTAAISTSLGLATVSVQASGAFTTATITPLEVLVESSTDATVEVALGTLSDITPMQAEVLKTAFIEIAGPAVSIAIAGAGIVFRNDPDFPRIARIKAESRVLIVPAEDRLMAVASETRIVFIEED